MRTRVKICGITRPEDALSAAQLGADAIGLVFYEPSPRHVLPEQARTIAKTLPPFVTRVGLFVDAPAEQVREVLQTVRLDLLQFHGDESPEYCAGFDMPYLKAIRMSKGVSLETEARQFADAVGLLVDSYSDSRAGGTGETFEWGRIPSGLDKPLVLAGGLTPANVVEAIRTVRPYAVDVSSGVEQEKGIKDAAKMAAFIAEVNKTS